MFNFTLFRIPVTVQPFHWVILAVFGSMGGLQDQDDFVRVVLFILAGFFSILIHEMGHALVGRRCGAPQVEVELNGMGGLASFPGAHFTRKQNFLTTAAGPAVQILAGLLFLPILLFVKLPEGLELFFNLFIWVSIVWALINCVPVWPLDGGQMLAAILGESRRPLIHQIGMITAGVGCVLCVFVFGLLFFGLLLGALAYQNWQISQYYRQG